ncbi:acetyl-CoA synthetase-like protein [Clavulina sp. PMI_390]|nr:acetyl-CoA synthetase-like protein [Clavulina sp. PMI_390]
MTVYQRDIPVSIPEISAFTHIFSQPIDDGRPAFIEASTNTAITRGELKGKALRLGSAFLQLSKLGRGPDLTEQDAVLLFSPNNLFYPVVTLASLASGVPVGCASAAAVPAELAHMIVLTKASFFIVHPTLFETFKAAMKLCGLPPAAYGKRVVFLSSKRSLSGESTVEDLIAASAPMNPVNFDGERSKKSNIYFFSSGTTGLPKAVEISHYNIVSTGRIWTSIDFHPLNEPGVFASPLPLYHIAGVILLTFYPLFCGYPSVVWATPYNVESFVDGMQRYNATAVLIVPPIALSLIRHPSVVNARFPRLRRIVCGAAPISGPDLRNLHERFKPLVNHKDFLVGSLYGMTETSCAGSAGFDGSRYGKYESNGRLMPGLQARLVDGNGRDVPPGSAGELWLRGGVVMNGYLQNPKATNDILTSDGWLKTGDIATIDEENFLSVIDRKKELIKYKGYQVPPAELEAILLQHPAVADAGVIGIVSPDRSTELPTAFVSLRDASLRANRRLPLEISEWFSPQVAHYKQLRGGLFVLDTVPRSPTGKVLRRQLREHAAAKATAPRL